MKGEMMLGLRFLLQKIAVALVLVVGLSATASAASDALYPEGWQNWPVVGTGTILGQSTPVPASAPVIVRETVQTYNWINDGKGSAYNVRINPAQMDAYKAGKGKFADGPTGVLELVDIKALLVTDSLLGEPLYGAFTFDGKDISGAHPSLELGACKTCHTGYNDYCVSGICSK
jgi:hypothetical protein